MHVRLRTVPSRFSLFVVATLAGVSSNWAQSPVKIVPRPVMAANNAAAAATPATVAPVASVPSQAPAPAPTPPPVEDKAIMVDKTTQSYNAKLGEESATFNFRLTNMSHEVAVITDVKTSCGCTVPKLPSKPWSLKPGEDGDLQLVVDLRGKSGTLVKTATVETKKGTRVLTMQIVVPAAPVVPPDPAMRDRNMQLAATDRQAVFKGDCMRCHVMPTLSLSGEPLYKAACGICHEAEHRATMVPDLHQIAHETSRDFWRAMIVAGKPGTLMPGFSTDMGGPLNRPQIDSLVEYLATKFPSRTAAQAATSSGSAAAPH